MININNDTIENLIKIIKPENTLFLNNLSLFQKNLAEQISFLQKKRMGNENKTNNLFFEKEFSIQNKNNIHWNKDIPNNSHLFNYGPLIGKPNFFCLNNNNLILNIKGINNNILNYLIPNDKINLENYNFSNNINTINNINFNLSVNHLNGLLFTRYNVNDENTKENMDENNQNIMLPNISLKPSPNFINKSKNSLDNNDITNDNKKNNYFNVTHEPEKPKKKIIRKYISLKESNNEIKVLKNNKVVYVNTFLLNSYSTSKNIKKLNKIAFIGRNKRSSRFRGVSKNGNQWQVLMMINKNKSYIGSYPSEELAARIYDILSLKNRGVKARTNFIYTNQEIKKICEMDIDIKSKNIYEIISQLFED